jgi:hypothetical protein
MGPIDFLKRADELLAKCKTVRTTITTSSDGHYRWVEPGSMHGLRAACLSFLSNTFGVEHAYHRVFVDKVTSSDVDDLNVAEAIIREAREEIAGGWTITLRALVAAEMFTDFSEMAEHLLTEGYKDPAAVIVGSMLEEHLRQVAVRANVEVATLAGDDLVPKKADRLNADLARVAAYSKLDQKNVTAWLDLRNNAAHGKYGAYSAEQVGVMLRGVTEFIARTQG